MTLCITLLSTKPCTTIEETLKTIQQGIAENPGSDVYVLPEAFLTGYEGDARENARKMSISELTEWLIATARTANGAIVGSTFVEVDGLVYNRMLFVDKDGVVGEYDQIHVDERLRGCCSAGNFRVIVDWHGMRFLMAVGNDLRHPIFCRNKDLAYDTLLCCADFREDESTTLLLLCCARSSEDLCFTVGCNSGGQGGSCIFDVWAQELGKRTSAGIEAQTAILDKARKDRTNSKYRIFDDFDVFECNAYGQVVYKR